MLFLLGNFRLSNLNNGKSENVMLILSNKIFYLNMLFENEDNIFNNYPIGVFDRKTDVAAV